MSTTQPLTRKQKEVLDFLKLYFDNNSIPPTLKEIATKFGFSIPTAQGYLSALVNKGIIARSPNSQRSIIFKDKKLENMTVSKPILGRISAGYGVTLFEESEPVMVEVPATMIPKDAPSYCLLVDGYSMEQDGILDGDIILIKQISQPSEGDTVVAVITEDFEERVTLKKFFLKDGLVELRPKNPVYDPIKLEPSKVQFRGKFNGLIRKD